MKRRFIAARKRRKRGILLGAKEGICATPLEQDPYQDLPLFQHRDDAKMYPKDITDIVDGVVRTVTKLVDNIEWLATGAYNRVVADAREILGNITPVVRRLGRLEGYSLNTLTEWQQGIFKDANVVSEIHARSPAELVMVKLRDSGENRMGFKYFDWRHHPYGRS